MPQRAHLLLIPFMMMASLLLSTVMADLDCMAAQPQVVISTIATTDNPVYVATGDLNGDGLLDLASASYNDRKIAVYRNLGDFSFGPQIVVTTSNGGAYSVAMGDLNGDGLLDLASTGGLDNTIAVYENQGDFTFGSKIVVSDTALGARHVAIGDLDNDGLPDLASASHSDNKIAAYKNLGDFTFEDPSTTVSTAAAYAHRVAISDLDNDGLLDLISVSYNDDKIAIYQNLGDFTFGPQVEVTTQADGAYRVAIGDLNGDGLMDLASASYMDDKVAVYENLGNFTFGPQIVVSIANDGPQAVAMGDMDGDGILDLASGSRLDSKMSITVYRGQGDFTFEDPVVVSTAADGVFYLGMADLDNDELPDLISTSINDDKIAIYHTIPCVCQVSASSSCLLKACTNVACDDGNELTSNDKCNGLVCAGKCSKGFVGANCDECDVSYGGQNCQCSRYEGANCRYKQ